jgi:predicted secreted Zn-dependent protease
MRRTGCAAVLAAIAGLCLAGPADASVKVKTNTTSYRISGKSGNALLDAMDRKGPKHGFLTRAIAQTGYTVNWEVDWREREDGSCLIANAAAVLTITYNYPEVTSPLSGDLQRRWQRFMAGVRKHEETHGRLAREMVTVAEKGLTHLSIKGDRGCRKTQAEMKRRIAAVYDKYEARQVQFDEVEHAEGGNVERLVNRLSGNPLLGRR